MAMAAGGQTINDRILAARHSLAGQGLAKAVCKATTEELIGPKRKHLEYLLRCTDEPNVSIPTLANLLLERTQSQNWIVVFKSLVTIHHLMCYGNERFTQYLASSNTNFQLSHFLDKSGVQDRMHLALTQAVIVDPYARAVMKSSLERIRALGYDMSPFVRRYSKYLSEKAVSYRTVAFDFCKVKRGKEGGTLRQMTTEKLLKALPVLHEQLDALLEFEATAQDLNNGVINCAFVLLFKDLIRLFACYNDGIINLLEKYFEMNKKHAREALDIYKKFLIRMDRVADFLKVAEKFGIDKNDIPDLAKNIGMDKSDIPDLAKAPSSLLEALESHLANLEGRKPGSLATTPTGAAGRVNVAAAVSILSSTSSAFGTASSSHIDEKLQRQLLAEEEQAMQKYKEHAKATNPFFSEGAASHSAGPAVDNSAPNILDLFGMSGEGGAMSGAGFASAQSSKASDDLLQLSGNPFASVLSAGPTSAASQQQQQPYFNSPFATEFPAAAANANGYFGMAPQQRMAVLSPSFGSDNSFNNIFGAPNNNSSAVGANFFGDILQPQGSNSSANGHSGVNGANGANGSGGTYGGGKIVGGDLDASIANLTSNLNLSTGPKKNNGALNRAKGPPMAAAGTGQARPF